MKHPTEVGLVVHRGQLVFQFLRALFDPPREITRGGGHEQAASGFDFGCVEHRGKQAVCGAGAAVGFVGKDQVKGRRRRCVGRRDAVR